MGATCFGKGFGGGNGRGGGLRRPPRSTDHSEGRQMEVSRPMLAELAGCRITGKVLGDRSIAGTFEGLAGRGPGWPEIALRVDGVKRCALFFLFDREFEATFPATLASLASGNALGLERAARSSTGGLGQACGCRTSSKICLKIASEICKQQIWVSFSLPSPAPATAWAEGISLVTAPEGLEWFAAGVRASDYSGKGRLRLFYPSAFLLPLGLLEPCSSWLSPSPPISRGMVGSRRGLSTSFG